MEKLLVFGFVAVNLVSPWLIGELYPFTISPMFCDEPTQCCDFEAFAADGTPIPLESIGLQRNYDGNPVGLGVGLVPPYTLDQFGELPTDEEVRDHVEKQLLAHPEWESIRVVIKTIGEIDSQHVGVIEDKTRVVTVALEDINVDTTDSSLEILEQDESAQSSREESLLGHFSEVTKS